MAFVDYKGLVQILSPDPDPGFGGSVSYQFNMKSLADAVYTLQLGGTETLDNVLSLGNTTTNTATFGGLTILTTADADKPFINLANQGSGGKTFSIGSTNNDSCEGAGKFSIFNATDSSWPMLMDGDGNVQFDGNIISGGESAINSDGSASFAGGNVIISASGIITINDGGSINLNGNEIDDVGSFTTSYLNLTSGGRANFVGAVFNLNTGDGTGGGNFSVDGGNITNVNSLGIQAGGNIITDTVTGMTIGTANTQKIAFFGASPVIQQNSHGSSNVTFAGIGTALKSDTTSTGGKGSTAYTTSDVIAALKTLGLLAS